MEKEKNPIYQEISDFLLEKKRKNIKKEQISSFIIGTIIIVLISLYFQAIGVMVSIYVALSFILLFLLIITFLPFGKIPKPTKEEIKIEAKKNLDKKKEELQKLLENKYSNKGYEIDYFIDKCKIEISELNNLIK